MTPLRRAFDILAAALGLILLAPLLAVIAAAIKLDDGGPVVFRQERTGRTGRPFLILKFRTMSAEGGARERPITVAGDPRITRAGRWLRRSKLDELLQLFNILRGEMTFVGPRPEVPDFTAHYDCDQRRVLDLVPGLTDPASIAFRNEENVLSGFDDPERGYIDVVMREKIRLNLEYSARRSWFSDIGVMARTVVSLLSLK